MSQTKDTAACETVAAWAQVDAAPLILCEAAAGAGVRGVSLAPAGAKAPLDAARGPRGVSVIRVGLSRRRPPVIGPPPPVAHLSQRAEWGPWLVPCPMHQGRPHIAPRPGPGPGLPPEPWRGARWGDTAIDPH